MADAHGDVGAVARDVVELQGPCAVIADVNSVHDGAGKLATVADVAGSASSLQKYDSGDDVYKGNVASFTTKDVQKIKAKGVASFCCKFKKWRCPYCTTKPNPKDGRFDHLLSHVEDVAIRGEDYKIRGSRLRS
ncbi:hypothetical protein D1007_28397 [Hordeum vulgare]|nr:hypothetical protein D1007_28397 [Hordeum vulgare]